ncbi:hypothetical protein N0V83_006166 [Neocucurbitaria cava]|uniref:Uncharacterized protein n=1 Tax=Neocucurbitaria cava TaxID=798079 RepID=A0A9W8Y914_9PLEO|nr:hypothetical protein N0V83_006166 [Neocucurbitaria cava]
MFSSTSTEHLLNSFPMFGHPGISALEYAGSVEATQDSQIVDSYIGDKRLTINPGSPIELDATETGSPSSPEVYRPSTAIHRRSVSVPMSSIVTYQPSLTASAIHYDKDISVRSVSNPIQKPQEKKRQRRQTPFKIAIPKATNPARHAPLEPLVAQHRRKASTDTTSDLPLHPDTGKVEEMGTFGVIQRYFDSQTGGPVVSPKLLCHTCSQDPSTIPLPLSPKPSVQTPFKEPIAIYPIDELDFPDEPPAVPERSPKRLTNPAFPIHVKTTMSMSSDFAIAAEGQYSPYDKQDDVLHVPKRREPTRIDVGQAAWVGSSHIGRMAPPILGHDALTASSELRLNDLSFYLKNTGPSSDSQTAVRQRKKRGVKIFKAQKRKSLAARVGSVEGSPQRARMQNPVPACAREMTTSSGARHRKIIIPTDRMSGKQLIALPASQPDSQRRSRHVSITFTEEMLNPLASSEVERMLSDFQTPIGRSFTEPISQSPRSPKRQPKSPKRVPVSVNDDPLASREEQTRARKLRDLQLIKRKPLPSHTQMEQHPDSVGGALPTPAQTPEPIKNPSVDGSHEDDSIDEESPANKMTQLQSRMVLLQRQNTELTDALAKIVGLELEEGDLKSEDVLRAFRQIRLSRTPSKE